MNASKNNRKLKIMLAVLGAAAALGLGPQFAGAQSGPGPEQGQLPRPDQRGEPRPDGFGGPDGRAPQGMPGRGGGPRRGPGPSGQTPPPPRETVQLSGTVTGHNFGPRGNVDALIIKSSEKSIQINLPPTLAAVVAQQAAVGGQVKITASPEMGMPDHPIYELTSLTTEQGRQLKLPDPLDRKFVHEEGTVKSLNYARHGEVDGVVLENGDFVQIGPVAASLKLTVSQKLTIDGVGHPMLGSEHRAVEAMAVDGKMIERGPGPNAGPNGRRGRGPEMGPEGSGGFDGPPQGPGGGPGAGGPDGPPPGRGRGRGVGDQGGGPGGPPRDGDGPPRRGNGRPPVENTDSLPELSAPLILD